MSAAAWVSATGRGLVERLTLVAALVISTAAGIPGITQSAATADTQTVEPTPLAVWYAVYAVVLVICARNARELLTTASRSRVVLLVAAWAVLSVAWSDAPSLSLHRAVALLLTTLLGLLLATRYGRDELFELVCRVLAAVVLASVAAAVLDPRYGLDHVRGDAWRGLFDTKNELGRIATLTAVLWLLRAIVRRGRLVSATVIAASVVAVDRSDSRTSLVVIAALAALVLAIPALRMKGELMVAACAFLATGLGSVAYWLLEHPGRVLGSLGASSTLTGRTAIWSAAWSMVERHMWFGYGYSGFWRGLAGPSAYVWAVVGSTPPHAHNGFLDTWLDLGAIGLVLVLLSLATTFGGAWSAMRRPGTLLQAWPLAFVVFLLLFNITESALVTRNSLLWIVYVAVAAGVGLERGTARAAVPERAARRARARLVEAAR